MFSSWYKLLQKRRECVCGITMYHVPDVMMLFKEEREEHCVCGFGRNVCA